jgi:hypothetical protein
VDCFTPVAKCDFDDRVSAQIRLGWRGTAERNSEIDRVDVHRISIWLGVNPDR